MSTRLSFTEVQVSVDLTNQEAESLTLAALLRYPDEWYSINDVGLVPSDFTSAENRKVMKAMTAVVSDKKKPDLLLVGEEIRMSGSDSTIEYLEALNEIPCSIAQAHEYARIVKSLSASRALANAGAKIIEIARDKRADYETAIAESEQVLRTAKKVGPPEGRSDHPADILERMRNALPTEIVPVRFSPTLQRVTGGMAPGHFWVIGGFSSVGKSAVAVNLTIDALASRDKKVAIISIEMTQEQYLQRLMSAMSGVPQRAIRDRITLPFDDGAALRRAEERLSKGNVRIVDTLYRMDQIRSYCTKRKAEDGLDVVMVDFIQNVVVKGDEFDDARNVALELQRLAKDLSCTVIGFSQVSNEMAKRDADGGDRNFYSFKGHGAIRDAADIALMLRRDRYGAASTLNMTVVKNRHGELADIVCNMYLETGSITEIETYGDLDGE
jgi:replicative DNA helicase